MKLLLDLVKAKDAVEEKQIIKILKTKPIRTGWIKKGGSLLVFGASHEKKTIFQPFNFTKSDFGFNAGAFKVWLLKYLAVKRNRSITI